MKGDIDADEPVLVRAHAEFLPGDVFCMAERNTAALLQRVDGAPSPPPAPGWWCICAARARGAEIVDAASAVGTSYRARAEHRPGTQQRDFREYGIGAQILRDVGVRKIRLLSNFPRRLVSLPGYGLEIVECVPLGLSVRPPAVHPPRMGRAARPRLAPAGGRRRAR